MGADMECIVDCSCNLRDRWSWGLGKFLPIAQIDTNTTNTNTLKNDLNWKVGGCILMECNVSCAPGRANSNTTTQQEQQHMIMMASMTLIEMLMLLECIRIFKKSWWTMRPIVRLTSWSYPLWCHKFYVDKNDWWWWWWWWWCFGQLFGLGS